MHGGEVGGLQQQDVAHAGVGAACNSDALLHTEEAWHQPFGGQALGVELHIADHGLQLASARQGAEKGHLGEKGRQAVVGVIAEEAAQRILPAGSRRNGRKGGRGAR